MHQWDLPKRVGFQRLHMSENLEHCEGAKRTWKKKKYRKGVHKKKKKKVTTGSAESAEYNNASRELARLYVSSLISIPFGAWFFMLNLNPPLFQSITAEVPKPRGVQRLIPLSVNSAFALSPLEPRNGIANGSINWHSIFLRLGSSPRIGILGMVSYSATMRMCTQAATCSARRVVRFKLYRLPTELLRSLSPGSHRSNKLPIGRFFIIPVFPEEVSW